MSNKAIDKARKAAARSEVQKRTVTFAPKVERRAAGDGGDEAIHVTGHAAVFDQPSEVLYDWWEGSYIEEIAPGAFAKTLQEADVRFLINHDPNLILARNMAGTLRLEEDEIGLAIDADLAPTTYGRDLAISMERNDVTQMSFMFVCMKDDWSLGMRDGLPLRKIQEVKLYDVSAVTFPGFTQTDIGMRSQEVRSLLESLGLSGVPAERRNALIAALTQGAPIPTDLAPVIRAAQRALGDLATNVEPDTDHSTRSLSLAKDRFNLKARELGLPDRVA